MSDLIHNPAHYTQYPVQPIEIARHLGFCLGNAVKYVLRAPFKGGVEDCDKALKYLEWEQESPQACISLADYQKARDKTEKLSDYLHGMPGTPWMEPITEHQADFLDVVQGYIDHEGLHLIAHMRNYVAKLADAIETPHCRVCGCTDMHACEGGCSWVEDDLCSACVEPESLSAFLAECCVTGLGLRISSSKLYARHTEWIQDSPAAKMSIRAFLKAMKAQGYTHTRFGGSWYWDGLGLVHAEGGADHA